MQLIAMVGGEIEYDGYSIGIRKHIGSETAIDIMKSSLVQDISYSHNVSENTTSYTLSLYQKGKLTLGDEIKIHFKPLSIDSQSRVVGMDWNPFNYKEVSITVGQYLPTINDSLYEIAGEVSDIREATAKYTIEFGEMIGNGTFYFTRSYRDRPYFHIHTDDGTIGTVELLKLDTYEFNPYIGARLTGVNSTTSTLLVFYCTVPADDDYTEEEIIKDGGYATSPTYVENICGIIEKWNLTQYDAKADSVTWYRVRKSWEDASSQIGAFKILKNAKACADKNPGYLVFDDKGVVVYGKTEFDPYLVRVSVADLNIRKGPGTNYAKTGNFTGIGVFTIIAEENGQGASRWGKLKSGAGWISLDYTKRI